MEVERETSITDTLVFTVNGQKFELSSADPSTTLLEFLRSNTRFKSVKLGCGEGGCGACIVLLSKYDPVTKQVDNFSVNSCLALLCSVNGCSITTSEGLGNSKDGFHPIHQRFAGFHASQCGFCTPGMCMSLFSALVNAEAKPGPEPPPGFSKLTVSEAEKSIAGNLCRCTGYRPIADACKSFAADVDIEDLGFNSFWNKQETRKVKVSRLPVYNPDNPILKYPYFLKNGCKSGILNSERHSWYSPVTLDELQCSIQTKMNKDGARVKLVVGDTGKGYYKELELYDTYIDLKNIPELSFIRRDHTGVELGATVTISVVIAALREEHKDKKFSEDNQVFQKIADHMEKIASRSIRNSASIGGNLVMAQRKHFPSDVATVLLSVGSMVSIMIGGEYEQLTLEKFLARPPLDSTGILLSIRIPYLEPVGNNYISQGDSKLLFETYRASPRPLGNALSYLNAAFLANVSSSNNGFKINDIKLAFGAYGTKHAVRAGKVEEYLSGKVLSIGLVNDAVKLIKATVIPEDGTSYPAYRSSLAVGFLFEFLHPLLSLGSVIYGDLPNGCTNRLLLKASDINNGCNHADHVENQALLSSAKQLVESSSEYYPVGEPVIKSGATLQASGEAVFVDDIPSPVNCLHGAFICSTKALARVKCISFSKEILPLGVTAIVSVKDIPTGGENAGVKTMFGFDPLFADELTSCTGQPLALVVADSQKHADIAANIAVVKYDTENLEPPILTVEEAVERSSFLEVPPFLYPAQVGDFKQGMAEADRKILSAELKLGSQYHFYMETQTALAVPDEDNCMVVYSSIQCSEYGHCVIARCLGIPEHNVRVITRRVGGGFGGKATKAMPVAAACALAAHTLNRPVRIYVNRKTDMVMAGGRHPMKITYSVGFKSCGKITALHLDILIDAGIFVDISPILPLNMMGAFKKYNWGALSFEIKLCKTNLPSRTAMRAPGEVQGSFIAEAIIEEVASALSIEVDTVRNQNIHTFESLKLFYDHASGEPAEYTLPSIWERLAMSSNIDHKTEAIKQYNQSNKWRKKGISRIPIIHGVMLRPTPGKVSILWDGSVVVEVGGIELGQGLWTKVKQMTAFALGSIQCEGTEDLLEKVRVIQTDTLSLIQGGFTAGSTTSESSCEAVRLCCNILVERLTPLKEKLKKELGSFSWDTLTFQAHSEDVQLSASCFFVPEFTSMTYLNYGAAVSEVEVDILTGETRILQSDIIYDCGQSLNPAVDLGQIEGAFIQGVGFFMSEEFVTNEDGMLVADSTWTYKIPTIDTIPKRFNVHLMNSGHHQKRVLSSKASGEPPLLLAASVHCATRAAIKEARKQHNSWIGSDGFDSRFQLDVPATPPAVKKLCGLDAVESYLKSLLST